MSPVGVGLAQLSAPPGDSTANRRRSVAAATALFDEGAGIVVLPELCVPWYTADRSQLLAEAESIDGPTVEAWSAAAASHGGIVVGGFCERGNDGALYNSAVAVSGDGVVGHYRKLHLFDSEKLCFEAGDLGLPTFRTAFGRLGICVCYDLRFVEVVRVLALSGADLICVPTAWIRGFDRRGGDRNGLIPHAQGAVLQANLSQVFVACASQAGRHGDLHFLGSSILAGPYGDVIAGPLARDRDELAVARVDPADATRAQVRSELIRPRADRRTDVYGVTLGPQQL
jgi:predicted amidohydrolase